jgi:hypothetical protein
MHTQRVNNFSSSRELRPEVVQLLDDSDGENHAPSIVAQRLALHVVKQEHDLHCRVEQKVKQRQQRQQQQQSKAQTHGDAQQQQGSAQQRQQLQQQQHTKTATLNTGNSEARTDEEESSTSSEDEDGAAAGLAHVVDKTLAVCASLHLEESDMHTQLTPYVAAGSGAQPGHHQQHMKQSHEQTQQKPLVVKQQLLGLQQGPKQLQLQARAAQATQVLPRPIQDQQQHGGHQMQQLEAGPVQQQENQLQVQQQHQQQLQERNKEQGKMSQQQQQQQQPCEQLQLPSSPPLLQQQRQQLPRLPPPQQQQQQRQQQQQQRQYQQVRGPQPQCAPEHTLQPGDILWQPHAPLVRGMLPLRAPQAVPQDPAAAAAATNTVVTTAAAAAAAAAAVASWARMQGAPQQVGGRHLTFVA